MGPGPFASWNHQQLLLGRELQLHPRQRSDHPTERLRITPKCFKRFNNYNAHTTDLG